MSTTLPIKQENAIKAYNSADTQGKALLTNLFGKDVLPPKNIMERIQSFEDIIEISGVDPHSMVQRTDETLDEWAYRQAKLIAQVYNGDIVLDPGNASQYKYYPWHKIVKDDSHVSGFGLSFGGCVRWGSISDVGVRLCFANSDHAVDAGKKFNDIYTNLKIR